MIEIKGEYINFGMYGDVEREKESWIREHPHNKIEIEIDEKDLFIATVYYRDGSKEKIEIKKNFKKIIY